MIRIFPGKLEVGQVFKESGTGKKYECVAVRYYLTNLYGKKLKLLKRGLNHKRMKAASREIVLIREDYVEMYNKGEWFSIMYPRGIKVDEIKMMTTLRQRNNLIDDKGNLRIGHSQKLTLIK